MTAQRTESTRTRARLSLARLLGLIAIGLSASMWARSAAPNWTPQTTYAMQARTAVQPQTVEPPSTINVTFDPKFPEDLKPAVRYAANVWSRYLSSTVPIEVEVSQAFLVDHQADSKTFWERDFVGGPSDPDLAYPVALANKLAGYDLHPDKPDIVIRLTNAYSFYDHWYTGIDGSPPPDEFDTVTCVLHEMAHGLGILSSFYDSDDNGYIDWGQGKGYRTIYDTFLQDANGVSLLDTDEYPNNSAKLDEALTSGEVRFGGTRAEEAYGGPPKLYTPDRWHTSSSITHLEYVSFRDPKDRMMLPDLGHTVIVPRPGDTVIAMLWDLGWNESLGCGSVVYDGVILFEHPLCGAIRYQFDRVTGLTNLDALAWSDKPSAIHIGPGWSARVFEHNDGQGASRCVRWSLWDLSQDTYTGSSRIMDNDISSIAVYDNSDCQELPSNPAPTPTPPPSTEDNTPPSAQTFKALESGATAYLAVSGAADNAGGSGIREVRFSAKFNNKWVGVGVDSTSPYSLAWDMCASGVPDGEVELGMEIWDHASNKWVWSEHKPNPRITKDHNCIEPSYSDGVYLYENTGLGGGRCYITQDEHSIGEACGSGWNDNVESTRIGGSYYFSLFKDDWYGGGTPYTGNPTGDLPSEWRNQASSIRIRRNNPAAFTLYKLGDYNGTSWASDRTIFDLGHWNFNDNAESIRVASGYGVIVCEHSDFKGTCGRATGPAEWSDLNAMAQGLRDAVSSIRVCSGTCPSAGTPPSLLSPDTDAQVNADEAVTLYWGGKLDQYYVELWGGGLGSTRRLGWTNAASWNVGILPASSNPYYWQVKGWRGYGETNWSKDRFYVSEIDETAPTVEVTSPPSGHQTNGPTVSVSASATDADSGVKQVEFWAWVDDSWISFGVDTSSPYEADWDISAVREGGVWVAATAQDNAGNSAAVPESGWTYITIDKSAPTSQVLPLPPVESSSSFIVRWTGSDNYTLSDLIFYDVQYQKHCSGPWIDWENMWNWPGGMFNGEDGASYCFRSRAYDVVGNIEAWPTTADAKTRVGHGSVFLPLVLR